MNIQKLAASLLRLKGQELSLLRYLGARWIILKVLLMAAGGVCLIDSSLTVKFVGAGLIGYAAGVAVADVRRFFITKRNWPIQEQLYDWDKITSIGSDEEDHDAVRSD